MSEKNKFNFELLKTNGHARAGIFHTPHGDIPTPVFAPVGTQATVKSLTPDQLNEIGVSMILSNTYHLYLRPGAELVHELGGLHTFMHWAKPILTDSGGFQVFSHADIRRIDEDGVNFKSYIDGSMHRFTPEKAIDIQQKLGADIMMAFDECAPPEDYEYNKKAMDRTHAWAERCMNAWTSQDQALFGIVQGGVFEDLRKESARKITSMGFPGHAIGGLSVGETKQEMHAMLEVIEPLLPADKPRYLMGVGSPEDLVNGVLRGVDIFDCVLPTRLARHKSAMTFKGRINLLNSSQAHNPSPIDETCECYTCRNFSRAYLRHLIASGEILASTLVSIHNINMLVELMRRMRLAIFESRFPQFAQEFLEQYQA